MPAISREARQIANEIDSLSLEDRQFIRDLVQRVVAIAREIANPRKPRASTALACSPGSSSGEQIGSAVVSTTTATHHDDQTVPSGSLAHKLTAA